MYVHKSRNLKYSYVLKINGNDKEVLVTKLSLHLVDGFRETFDNIAANVPATWTFFRSLSRACNYQCFSVTYMVFLSPGLVLPV